MSQDADDRTTDEYVDISIPLEEVVRQGTLLSVLLLVAPLVFYVLVHGADSLLDVLFAGGTLLWSLPLLIVSILAHEGLHALAWMLFGGLRAGQIRFGFDRRYLAPYAHARADMPAWAYRVGVLAPGLLLGLLPVLAGLLWALPGLTLLAAFMLSAAIGDVMVFWIIRAVPGDALVRDHPSQAGCLVRIERPPNPDQAA